MRLARVRTTEGTVGVAVLADDGSAQLLDLSGSESVNSLADLLHSADPVAGGRLLEKPGGRRPFFCSKSLQVAFENHCRLSPDCPKD